MNRSLVALAAALFVSAASPTPALADTLISNVNGIQVGPAGKLQHFRALVISEDGKVRLTIEHPELVRLAGITETVDGGGRTLLPGLIDAHGHVVDLGTAALTLDLVGTGSIAQMQQRLRDYVAQRPDDPWLVGFGWNQESWADKRFPTSADLDAVVADRPVVLERVDGHAIVVNGAALRKAGITASIADPAGGKIERDSTGQPTGLFVDSARSLIESKIPPATSARADEALEKAQQKLLSFGVTAVGAMSVSDSDWAAFRRAGDAGRLQVRLMAYALNHPLSAAPAPTGWLYSDRLREVGVKLFADGALGSRGAWLKKPYADKPDTRGLPRHSDAEYLALADSAAAAGFQVATHAIGDAANAQIVTASEQLSKKYGADRRWRIEHFQIADPADIPRLAPAGIVASMQPTHQTSDRLMAEARLGPDRLAGAYAWQSVLKSGAKLAFGSDFPVESPNPFPGLAAAISRQDSEGRPAGGWIPAERLTFAQALYAFTRGAAFAGFAEDRIGALEAGKWADFIIVDRDPTTVDAQALGRTEVLETWVAGKPVWRRPVSASPAERGK
ncbi:MAG: amidohydrolase family protein [Sphingomicrobium sp.]